MRTITQLRRNQSSCWAMCAIQLKSLILNNLWCVNYLFRRNFHYQNKRITIFFMIKFWRNLKVNVSYETLTAVPEATLCKRNPQSCLACQIPRMSILSSFFCKNNGFFAEIQPNLGLKNGIILKLFCLKSSESLFWNTKKYKNWPKNQPKPLSADGFLFFFGPILPVFQCGLFLLKSS